MQNQQRNAREAYRPGVRDTKRTEKKNKNKKKKTREKKKVEPQRAKKAKTASSPNPLVKAL